MANPSSVDPGKAPGSAEGGALDEGPLVEKGGGEPQARRREQKPPDRAQQQPPRAGYVEGQSKLDRKRGDPPA